MAGNQSNCRFKSDKTNEKPTCTSHITLKHKPWIKPVRVSFSASITSVSLMPHRSSKGWAEHRPSGHTQLSIAWKFCAKWLFCHFLQVFPQGMCVKVDLGHTSSSIGFLIPGTWDHSHRGVVWEAVSLQVGNPKWSTGGFSIWCFTQSLFSSYFSKMSL